jgi:hypothetical protein
VNSCERLCRRHFIGWLETCTRERCEKNAAEEGSVVVAETLEEDSTNEASTPPPPRSVNCSEFDESPLPLRRWPT